MLDESTLAKRIGLMTSSVLAGALGLDPDKSPVRAWLDIRGESGFDGNAKTERGEMLEDKCLDYGAKIVPAPNWERPPFVVHSEHDWAGDSCDALYTDDWGDVLALGEAKTVGLAQSYNYGEQGTDQVPAKVLIQACWHLAHWPQAPLCVVPILVGGYEFVFKHYVIRRNEELIGILLQDAEKWHRDYVVAGIQPPVTWQDSEFLASKYPRAEDRMAEPTAELDALALEAVAAQTALKLAEEQYEALRNALREKLGSAAGVKGNGYSIVCRNEARAYTKWKALALHLGASEDLIQQYTQVPEDARVLRIYGKKQKASP